MVAAADSAALAWARPGHDPRPQSPPSHSRTLYRGRPRSLRPICSLAHALAAALVCHTAGTSQSSQRLKVFFVTRVRATRRSFHLNTWYIVLSFPCLFSYLNSRNQLYKSIPHVAPFGKRRVGPRVRLPNLPGARPAPTVKANRGRSFSNAQG